MLLGGGVSGRRQRELAGNTRAGSFGRARARTRQQAFVRSNWAPFSAFLFCGSVLCLAVSWSMPNGFLAGAVVGGGAVALPGALWILTTQMTGTVPTMMGDEAEQWTAGQLRQLVRSGWRLVNHVSLRQRDVDHVMLGPGGAYAVETKWSSSWDTSYGRQRVAAGVDQARDNARDLRLWHPFKSLGIVPHPVLVLWGPGLSQWGPDDRIRLVNDVTVVAGPALSEWTSGLNARALSAEQVALGWSALEEHVGRRDPVERERFPVPLSVTEWTVRVSSSLGFAALGLVAFGQTIVWTQSIPLTLALACGAVTPSAVLLRSGKWPWVAWSWVSGVGLPAVAVLVAQILRLVS